MYGARLLPRNLLPRPSPSGSHNSCTLDPAAHPLLPVSLLTISERPRASTDDPGHRPRTRGAAAEGAAACAPHPSCVGCARKVEALFREMCLHGTDPTGCPLQLQVAPTHGGCQQVERDGHARHRHAVVSWWNWGICHAPALQSFHGGGSATPLRRHLPHPASTFLHRSHRKLCAAGRRQGQIALQCEHPCDDWFLNWGVRAVEWI